MPPNQPAFTTDADLSQRCEPDSGRSNDTHLGFHFPFACILFKAYTTVHFGKEGVVLPHPDIFPGMHFGSELPDENIPRFDLLPAIFLDASSLTLTVPAIPGTSTRFFMSHLFLPTTRFQAVSSHETDPVSPDSR